MSSDGEQCGATKNDGNPCTYPPKHPDGRCGHHTRHGEPKANTQTLLEQSPEIKDLIAGEVQNGATIGEACSEANINRSTHDNWINRGKQDDADDIYQEYRREVTRARRTAAKNERRQLKVMCAEAGDTRTYWKIHQEQYGDLYADDVGAVEDRVPIFNVPDEIAKEWQQVATTQ